jgi:hypothetical protein
MYRVLLVLVGVLMKTILMGFFFPLLGFLGFDFVKVTEIALMEDGLVSKTMERFFSHFLFFYFYTKSVYFLRKTQFSPTCIYCFSITSQTYSSFQLGSK